MSKLKLSIDGLRVESFETYPVPASRGTIHGHDTYHPEQTCNALGCNQENTVGLTCGCESEYCTNDPLAPHCMATAQFTCQGPACSPPLTSEC